MKVRFSADGEDAAAIRLNAQRLAAAFAGGRRWVIQDIRVTIREEERGGVSGRGWVKAWVED